MTRRPVLVVLGVSLFLAGTPAFLSGQSSSGPSAGPSARTLQIAAASDLRFALAEVAAAFEQAAGVRVLITLGASGLLAAQIDQGAPFDLFFSANEAFVRDLARRGAVDPSTVARYAVGRIVVWVRRDSPLDVRAGLPTLADPRIRFIAIANPQHAPYGAAAGEALRRAGLYERVENRLVYAENISQALQFVQSGNADAGVIALSLAVAPPVEPTGRFGLIPAAAHAPIVQAAGVTARAAHPALAGAFLRTVLSPAGQTALRKYGFAIPRGVPHLERAP